MKTISTYLDDLKEKTGSDYKSAKLLKTGTNTISMIRKRNQCGDETAIKIADLLGINRNEVLIAAAIARSEGDVKKAWETISKQMGIAASFALVCAMTLENSSAGAFAALQSFYDQVCILCKIVYRIISGIDIALDSFLTIRSQKHGNTTENKLLPYAQKNNAQRFEMRRVVRRRCDRDRTNGQRRRTDHGRAPIAFMG